ncbi:MAG: hypothetical protein IPL62_19285 [Caulobacteraceae bacterium]|nr:hypothetical protein [Caulobacteraceae bacterium]
MNRTTTSETEIIVGALSFTAVVSFMSEEEAQFEIRECVGASLLRAIDQASDADVARALLERSDMRFRLKYILGAWPAEDEDEDPYEIDAEQSDASSEAIALPFQPTAPDILSSDLRSYVARIRTLAEQCRAAFEANEKKARSTY